MKLSLFVNLYNYFSTGKKCIVSDDDYKIIMHNVEYCRYKGDNTLMAKSYQKG
jgi:hypothetical protein